VANIDNDDEGRPAILFRQGLGVRLGLLFCGGHYRVPAATFSLPGAGAREGRLAKIQSELNEFFRPRVLFAFLALLAFEDEATTLVEIDAAGRVCSVIMLKRNSPLKNVFVFSLRMDSGLRSRQTQCLAQLHHERLKIRTFRSAGFLPACDEGLDGVF
jgi:hypothetical protein